MFQPVKSNNKEPAQVFCWRLFLLPFLQPLCFFGSKPPQNWFPDSTSYRPQPLSGVCIFYRNAKKQFMECVKIQLVDTTLKELWVGNLEAASLRWDTQICALGGEYWSTSQVKFVAKHCGNGKIAKVFSKTVILPQAVRHELPLHFWSTFHFLMPLLSSSISVKLWIYKKQRRKLSELHHKLFSLAKLDSVVLLVFTANGADFGSLLAINFNVHTMRFHWNSDRRVLI